MTVLPRILFGQRGSSIGIFVSKPGKNVLTVSDDDMLLSPTRTPASFLTTGYAQLPAKGLNGHRAINFGDILSDPPVVLIQLAHAVQKINFIPALQRFDGVNNLTVAPPRFHILTSLADAVIVNDRSAQFKFKYMVMKSALPSG